MEHVLTIQDLSCVGRCSATVVLPVLSAMGVQCSLLPTAVLSTHSAYPGFRCRDLTEDLCPMADHWAALGIRFDGLYTGYLAGPDQVSAVLSVLDRFRSDARVVLVDPAMADHGRLYGGLPADFPQAMGELCRRADVILPNLTEAALLTGRAYDPDPGEGELESLLTSLLSLGPKSPWRRRPARRHGLLGRGPVRKSVLLRPHPLPQKPPRYRRSVRRRRDRRSGSGRALGTGRKEGGRFRSPVSGGQRR